MAKWSPEVVSQQTTMLEVKPEDVSATREPCSLRGDAAAEIGATCLLLAGARAEQRSGGDGSARVRALAAGNQCLGVGVLDATGGRGFPLFLQQHSSSKAEEKQEAAAVLGCV